MNEHVKIDEQAQKAVAVDDKAVAREKTDHIDVSE